MGMKVIWAVPVIASILILGAISVISPMQTANAGGPTCPPDNVTISLQRVKQANAGFDNTNSFVSFNQVIEDCAPENEPPTVVIGALISISGCFEFLNIGSQDFVWGFGRSTLTLENTSCGDIFVEWQGIDDTGGSTNSSNSGDNCNDGNTYFHHKNKFKFATSTLWVDGEVFDTSVDEIDAVIARGITQEIRC